MSNTPTIVKDRTGFPMVWVEPIKAWLHFLPVTKIQLEAFICDTNASTFDAKWYDNILRENGRIAPQSIKPSNYWKAFATGLVPSEADSLARWMGEDYAIPTHEEWFQAYCHLKEMPWEDGTEPAGNLSGRAEILVKKIDKVMTEKTRGITPRQNMAHRMLMRWGVLEWVNFRVGRYDWGVYGETDSDFHSLMYSPEQGSPQGALRPELDRFFYFGCRLLRRP